MTGVLRWSAIALLVVLPLATSTPAPVESRADLAHDLSMLATGTPATEADLAKLAAGGYSSAEFSKYIDELVRRPAVAAVASRVLRLIGGGVRAVFADAILKQHVVGKDTVYYLHEPCDPKQAETVKPWWDLDSKVLVCPEAHRPTVFHAKDGNYCTGVYAAPYQKDSVCGCGPNLIRCMRSEADKDAFRKAITAEASGTVAWIVNNDLPLPTLFSSQESFRPPLAELLYQRWMIENRTVPSLEALPDWRKWPADGTWARRLESKPDQHAGIFTNNFHPQGADSQRLKVAGFLDTLWCSAQDSLQVKTAEVLDVSRQVANDLRGHVGWEELASRPLCTKCHARIDHGVQFFGWQFYYNASHYVAEKQQDIQGAMYLDDIDDERGRAKRNPQGFVKVALQQPEFASCMAKDFVVHAFGSDGEPDLASLDATLRKIVERKGTYRELLKATLERYKERVLSRPERRAYPPFPDSNAKRAAQIATFVDKHCSDCHGDAKDTDPPALILKRGASWCQAAGAECSRIGVEILSAVAFDRMPKGHALDPMDKGTLFELVAPIAWPNVRTRALAHRYFNQIPRAVPIHALDATTRWIQASGPASDSPLKLPAVPTGSSFSTTTAAHAAMMAASVCATAPDREACIAKAMDPRAFEK